MTEPPKGFRVVASGQSVPGFRVIETAEDELRRQLQQVELDESEGGAPPSPDTTFTPTQPQTALQSAAGAFTDITGPRFGFDTPETRTAVRNALGGQTPVLRATGIPNVLTGAAELGAGVLESAGGAVNAGLDLAGSLAAQLIGTNPETARRGAREFGEFAGLFLGNQASPLASRPISTAINRSPAAREVRRNAARLRELASETASNTKRVAEDAIVRVAIGGDDPRVVAQNLVEEALRLDQINPSEITSGSLIQRGGENLRALARSAGSRVGRSREIIEQYKNDVVGSQLERVRTAAENALGGKNGFFDEFESLIDQRTNSAAPLYAQAFEETVPVSRELTTLLNRPSGKAAIKRARKIADEQGDTFELGEEAISVRDLDRIKRGLDDAIERFRDPVTGRLPNNNNLNAIQGTRREFLRQIENLSPTYKAARDSFSGPSQSLDFLQRGRQFMRRNPEQIRSVLRDAGQSDREFFRSGTLRGIFDELDRIGDNQNAIRAKLTAPRFRNQVRALFDDESVADDFVNTLVDERNRFMRAQAVSPRSGSQTQQRTSDSGFFTRIVELMDTANGNPFGVTRRVAGRLNSLAAERAQQEVFDEVARIVTREIGH